MKKALFAVVATIGSLIGGTAVAFAQEATPVDPKAEIEGMLGNATSLLVPIVLSVATGLMVLAVVTWGARKVLSVAGGSRGI